jgi:hypothetical protein
MTQFYIIYNNNEQIIITTDNIKEVENYFLKYKKELIIHDIKNGKFISQKYRDDFKEILYCAKYKTKKEYSNNLYIIHEGEKAGSYPPYEEFSIYITESEDDALKICTEIFDEIHEDETYHDETDENGKKITTRKCRKNFIQQMKETKGFSADDVESVCTRDNWFIEILPIYYNNKMKLNGDELFYFMYDKKEEIYLLTHDKDNIITYLELKNKDKLKKKISKEYRFEEIEEKPFPLNIESDCILVEFFMPKSKNNSYYIFKDLNEGIYIEKDKKNIIKLLKGRKYKLSDDEINTFLNVNSYKNLTIHEIFINENLNLNLNDNNENLVYFIHNSYNDEMIATRDRKKVYSYYKENNEEIEYNYSVNYDEPIDVGGYGKKEYLTLIKTYFETDEIFVLIFLEDGGGGSYQNFRFLSIYDSQKEAIEEAMDYFDNYHNHEDEQDDEIISEKECRLRFRKELKNNNIAEMYDGYDDYNGASINKIKIN